MIDLTIEPIVALAAIAAVLWALTGRPPIASLLRPAPSDSFFAVLSSAAGWAYLAAAIAGFCVGCAAAEWMDSLPDRWKADPGRDRERRERPGPSRAGRDAPGRRPPRWMRRGMASGIVQLAVAGILSMAAAWAAWAIAWPVAARL